MTLVVAGVAEGAGWIVSDTLITSGTIQLRDREYQIKCLPSQDRQALVAFSGDAHNGDKLIERAAGMPSGYDVVRMLREAQAEHPNTDFVYLFMDKDGPHLYKISEGFDNNVIATFVGAKNAFEEFQCIRHATKLDPVPKSLETFWLGTRAPSKIPDAVGDVTLSMLRLFMQRTERDVGGWAVPYVMVPEGVYMCGYLHAFSDPIFDMLTPGAVVPHGTAEAGGYGLAVTEFGQLEGMVVYRRQMPGGLVLIREAAGYRTVSIEGEPAEFCAKAASELGKPVDICFGGPPLGVPESISVVHDEQGQPAIAIARRGNNISFSVLNLATAFRTKMNIDFHQKGLKPVTVKNLTLTLADDKSQVILKLLNDGEVVGESTLNASELDAVIAGLGQFRSALPEQVSREPNYSGSPELVVPDPAWRTLPSPHADADGIIMRLRHIGLGWVSFLLPRNEGRALGKWLTESCAERSTKLE